MLNHTRTLLLNLSYNAPNEHIPQEYKAKTLPATLQMIYDVLFPVGITRFYKLFLVQNYLNLIEAAGMTDQVLAYDNRISYSLYTTDYFKINRISNPKLSNLNYPIFISGELASKLNSDYHFDSYLISQVDDQNIVTVYSQNNRTYIKDNITTLDPTTAQIVLNFSGGFSNQVPIGVTGLSFIIGASTSFTDSSDKTWQFIAESPYTFNALDVYDRIKSLSPFNALKKYGVDLTQFENIWNQHYNTVYKLAALLLAFAAVVNIL